MVQRIKEYNDSLDFGVFSEKVEKYVKSRMIVNFFKFLLKNPCIKLKLLNYKLKDWFKRILRVM